MRSAVLLALLALACAAPVPPPAAASQTPEKAPDIRGVVTRVQANEIRVEAMPHESHGTKAVVKITKDTTIRDKDGNAVNASALREGQTVSVWYAGAVAQSYPLQADAAQITIE